MQLVHAEVARRLLAWYGRQGRDLPWRNLPAGRQGTRDPYKILVSEVMLQQTQVPRVLLFYKTWLKRFPTWKALARATNGEAVRVWAGLGYNRRALMLRDIAIQYVIASEAKQSHEFASSLRSSQRHVWTSEEWIKLKGIGPYTAAAVALFSGAEVVVPIDTNVRRVWGRVLLGKPFPTPQLDEQIRSKLGVLMHGTERADDLIQATFDLATSICTKQPMCDVCPLKDFCPAGKRFLSGKLQAPKRTTPFSNERIHTSKKHPDRIFRGRILKALREAPRGLALDAIADRIDPTFDAKKDREWLQAMMVRLKKDGMVRFVRGKILLHE